MRLSLALVTDDLPRLVSFYRLVLGLEPRGDGTYVEFTAGDDWVLAIVVAASLESIAPGAHSAAANRSVRIELEVADVDAAFARVGDAVSGVVAPPTDWPWGTRAAWVRDPDGNLVSLFTTVDR